MCPFFIIRQCPTRQGWATSIYVPLTSLKVRRVGEGAFTPSKRPSFPAWRVEVAVDDHLRLLPPSLSIEKPPGGAAACRAEVSHPTAKHAHLRQPWHKYVQDSRNFSHCHLLPSHSIPSFHHRLLRYDPGTVSDPGNQPLPVAEHRSTPAPTSGGLEGGVEGGGGEADGGAAEERLGG